MIGDSGQMAVNNETLQRIHNPFRIPGDWSLAAEGIWASTVILNRALVHDVTNFRWCTQPTRGRGAIRVDLCEISVALQWLNSQGALSYQPGLQSFNDCKRNGSLRSPCVLFQPVVLPQVIWFLSLSAMAGFSAEFRWGICLFPVSALAFCLPAPITEALSVCPEHSSQLEGSEPPSLSRNLFVVVVNLTLFFYQYIFLNLWGLLLVSKPLILI